MAPDEQPSPLTKRFPEWFALSRAFFELNNLVISNWQHKGCELHQLELHQIIIAFNHYKATNAFLATTQLCSLGLVGDAKTICRKLIDLCINMSYLAQDREHRQDQYWNFVAFSTVKQIKKKFKQIGTDANRAGEFEFLNQIESLRVAFDQWVQRAKEKFERDEFGEVLGDPSKSWSGLHLEEMAKRCGLSWDYIDPYVMFCRSTHASMDDFTNYCDLSKQEFGSHFEHSDVPLVMHEACRCYWWLLMMSVSAYHLDLVRSLYRLLDDLRVAERKYFPQDR